MSQYQVINAVDRTLRHVLWSTMQNDTTITRILPDEQRISFEPPFRLVRDAEPEQNALSFYLYRIVENPDMKNRPLELVDPQRLRYPPLSLNLFYLVTPVTNNAENDHLVLGKTMQILHDHAIIREPELQDILADPADTTEELRVIFNSISLEDTNKLWSAFMRPYRLAVSYEVKVIYIDSERETGGERVRRKRLEMLPKTELS
ncbi:MAG: DUF4255 domain-containing protein [bacterium]